MWELFRRRPKGWMSLADYRKQRERELKRNPGRLEEEQEQARKWSLQIAEKKRKENSRRLNDKER